SKGTIVEVSEGYLNGSDMRLDVRGRYLLPGFIDLHSDAIEKEIEPRASAIFPLNMAIFEMDKKLAACGITTMYHSLSYSQEPEGVRNNGIASDVVREVNRLAPCLGVRTRIHARFEITSRDATPYLERLLDEGYIQFFSIMDHGWLEKNNRRFEASALLQKDYVRGLVDRCHSVGIPVASHDIGSKDELDAVERMGIRYTEFPLNMDAAAMAVSRGMQVCLGSPNVVRGGSFIGNMSARDALKAGIGDILCSDYSPMSSLHAVFTLERLGMTLNRAANMTSLSPARAAGISDITGSLEEGKSADMIIVDTAGEVPRVVKTFAGGREVYSTW
ncbi:MAG TPA: alpha-D-ribose 1-methylphosphonate 5-triphosphate diphosphatase, partial [Methanocella sp.]|nr:alpha-D-ribose 1-methylphosphonate 5-triphosphate diphosphatase [Methanocella sp.]